MTRAYYNEIEPYCVDWLRNLIAANLITPGVRLLAHGVPNRVAKLRAFGNAIDPRCAAKVIEAYMTSQ